MALDPETTRLMGDIGGIVGAVAGWKFCNKKTYHSLRQSLDRKRPFKWGYFLGVTCIGMIFVSVRAAVASDSEPFMAYVAAVSALALIAAIGLFTKKRYGVVAYFILVGIVFLMQFGIRRLDNIIGMAILQPINFFYLKKRWNEDRTWDGSC